MSRLDRFESRFQPRDPRGSRQGRHSLLYEHQIVVHALNQRIDIHLVPNPRQALGQLAQLDQPRRLELHSRLDQVILQTRCIMRLPRHELALVGDVPRHKARSIVFVDVITKRFRPETANHSPCRLGQPRFLRCIQCHRRHGPRAARQHHVRIVDDHIRRQKHPGVDLYRLVPG